MENICVFTTLHDYLPTLADTLSRSGSVCNRVAQPFVPCRSFRTTIREIVRKRDPSGRHFATFSRVLASFQFHSLSLVRYSTHRTVGRSTDSLIRTPKRTWFSKFLLKRPKQSFPKAARGVQLRGTKLPHGYHIHNTGTTSHPLWNVKTLSTRRSQASCRQDLLHRVSKHSSSARSPRPAHRSPACCCW